MKWGTHPQAFRPAGRPWMEMGLGWWLILAAMVAPALALILITYFG